MVNYVCKLQKEDRNTQIQNTQHKYLVKCLFQNILKQDINNYNALVFLGVAAEGVNQPEEAQMAYKKAIDVDPTNILAWQVNKFSHV